jgi:methionyl-tRNA formyltransferase
MGWSLAAPADDSYEIDLIVTAAYGKIIPKEILDIAKFGAVNIHGSLLPKYRGAAPIQRAIMDGEKTTGVTLMLMDKGMDTGEIIRQRSVQIGDKNYSELESELAKAGADMLLSLIADISGGTMLNNDGRIIAKKQDDKIATLAPPICKDEGELNLQDEPEINMRKVRAISKNPGTYIVCNDTKIRVNEAEIKDGKFAIKTLTPPGKRQMSIDDYMRGNPVFKEIQK